jgi:hypothetical protein
MWMPIILLCSSVYAESCLVVTRNWQFYDTLELCLEISESKAKKAFEHPQVYHVKPMCQEIILNKET